MECGAHIGDRVDCRTNHVRYHTRASVTLHGDALHRRDMVYINIERDAHRLAGIIGAAGGNTVGSVGSWEEREELELEMENNSVSIVADGQTLKSDRCIWCGSTIQLSRSHVFPESIGGKFQPTTTCTDCNNYFGRTVEADLKKNAMFVAAIATFGLATKKEAFRHAHISDPETNHRFKIDDDGFATVVPRKLKDTSFIGTQEEVKEYFLAWIRKNRPNWPPEPLIQYIEGGSTVPFRYACEVFVNRPFRSEKAILTITNLSRELDPNFLFKISFELLNYLFFPKIAALNHYLRGFYAMNLDSSHRIQFDESMAEKVIINTTSQHVLRNTQLDQIPFKPFHGFCLRLTGSGTPFLELVFFGVLRYLFVIPPSISIPEGTLELLERSVTFELEHSEMTLANLENLRNVEQYVATNSRVDSRASELVVGGDKFFSP